MKKNSYSLDKHILDGQFNNIFSQHDLEKYYLSLIKKKILRYHINNEHNVFFTSQYLDWDSDILKQNVIRINYLSDLCNTKKKLEQAINLLTTKDIIYLRTHISHPIIKIINQFHTGFKEYAQKEMFKYQVKPENIKLNPNIKAYKLVKSDTKYKEIINLSKTLFTENRFVRDKHFPDNFASSVYLSWIKDKINTEDNIFCYLHNNKIIGFIIASFINKSFGDYSFIELIGTDKNYQNRSIATSLLNYVKIQSLKKKMTILFANIDSKNHNSIKFFKKNNFKQFNSLKEFHWRQLL